MTLQQYLDLLGWTIGHLASEASIDYSTAKKAVEGQPIRSRPATAIADAISRATGERVFAGQIKGLRIA